MQSAIGFGILGIAALTILLSVRHFLKKRRKVRQRGTTHRGRIDIPLSRKD